MAHDAWRIKASSAIIDGEIVVPAADGTTDFNMTEVISGQLLLMIGGSLPDFKPPFEQYAADLKRDAEKSEISAN